MVVEHYYIINMLLLLSAMRCANLKDEAAEVSSVERTRRLAIQKENELPTAAIV